MRTGSSGAPLAHPRLVLPLRDDSPTPVRSYGVLALVLLHALVLIAQHWPGVHSSTVLGLFGLIPQRFLTWTSLGGTPHDPWRFVPLFTSMFLHDGWVHLGTNMVYLWTFGRALEGRFGRGVMLSLYFVSGFASALGQLVAYPGSQAAMIGASGAIAGVLGAYLVCFSRRTITVAFPFVLLPWVVKVRATTFLLAWFGLQVGSGTIDLVRRVNDAPVAWWAHATGFLTGAACAMALTLLESEARRRRSMVPALQFNGRAPVLAARLSRLPSIAP